MLYTYNQETDSYQPVRYPLWQRCMHISLYIIGGIFVGVFIYILVQQLTGDDREEKLMRQNEELQNEIKSLQKQTDQALAVMRDIADRDNNFYRVIMQADPLTDAQRYAGLERQMRLNAIDSLNDNALLKSLRISLDQLESQLYSQSKSFDFLRAQAIKNKGRLEYIPAIAPLAHDNIQNLSSGFGRRTDPVYGVSKMHEGMDFRGDIGTPIYATANGTVNFAGWRNGYGYIVTIDHGYDYETRYAHLSKILVKEGQKVTRGQEIGLLGNSGKSTGPHLHYEVRYKDRPQNPINYYFYDLDPEQYDQLIRQAQNAGHVMD